MTVPGVLDAPSEAPEAARPERTPRADVARIGLALAAWCALILAAWRAGLEDRVAWKLRAAPIVGAFDLHGAPATIAAVVVGLVGAVLLPRWAQRTSWRRLLLGTVLLAAGWGVLLAVARGTDGLTSGLAGRHAYAAVLPEVDALGVGRFVRTFTDPSVLAAYPVHVEGHPVGVVLAYWGLDAAGFTGLRWAAAWTIAIGATTWAALLIAVREVAGERWARSLAPFAVLSPAAVWMVTSADAVFAAVGAWGIALIVLATRPGRAPRATAAWSAAGGAVLGLGLQLTYGLVPLILVAATVALVRRRWAVLAWAAVGGLAVLVAAAGAGFWWLDGLAATHLRYEAGIASERPRGYFTFLGNPAAFAVALGPAGFVALALVRDRRLWLLGGAGLAAVLIANASGLSKAEVERIWLPFVPWVLVLCAGLAGRSRRLVPLLLSLQVLTAVAVESLVSTPW